MLKPKLKRKWAKQSRAASKAFIIGDVTTDALLSHQPNGTSATGSHECHRPSTEETKITSKKTST